jgi:2-keto-4-pentenoate hydratase/2-oxohepta-3-ene-1,7-dioic acid hydratase in catechol pathway
MKLCRFQPQLISPETVGAASHPEVFQGVITGGSVREVSGSILGEWTETSRTWPLTDVKLLPPSVPSKIVCIGKNYVDHAAEFNSLPPSEPLIFLKPPTAVLPPEENIVLPPSSKRVDYEGELAVIIGKNCSYLEDSDDVRPYIAGFTCLNDVSARDLQASDKQWTRAKGFDTFCPFGPVLETEFDIATNRVETFVNGVKKQSSSLTLLVFPVDVIIRFISRVMTLLPGDVIATGTPAGVGPLAEGDVVEVSISGIGTLRNPVIARRG